MKIYQLITLPSLVDLDRDDVEHAARTPNPVFLTLAGAQQAALDNANGERFEYCKDFCDGEDPEADAQIITDYHQLEEIEWALDVTDPPDAPDDKRTGPEACFTWNDDATDITYVIHELEAGQ